MFDIGWTELMVIGVVALIVIGPKDLPEMFRTLGRFTAKARGMARDFSKAMENAADEAGVKDVAKDLKNVTSAKSMGLDAVKNAATKFEKWDPAKQAKINEAARNAEKPAPGPNTQALAEAQAAKREDLLASAPKPAAEAPAVKPEPAAKSVAKAATKKAAAPKKAPAAKVAASKTTSKTAPKTAPKTAANTPAAAKAPRKPSVKKSDA
jgi:sec-independent protein translocase protein TatB